jgi:hypothetical protein
MRYGKYGGKISKLWEKSKLNKSKAMEIRRKRRLKCEMIWIIWKKCNISSLFN